ncbi:electron transfer flavoprotein subunit alpha/FixB family protein [Ornithinimicrobium avium]|uniref:Electron transfer flavoprotein subunit alpha/FixB family protein n=1 Tax=Ornithinimicrobium avium TaxID=2283195 RepID=A0A345NQZ7_9MICO|nr:electron transfer flavoprotein subunit alpha/FixB family protein [Ornithinimicrobium avium]AXH97455.1 electron transfer flavoprotein subunit alpha/FixB family protein [Ornithinimicrobium avium]
MSNVVLVLIEPDEGRVHLVSREALTFARPLAGQVQALMLGRVDEAVLADCREQGVAVVHEATDAELESYAAAAWATALERSLEASGAGIVLAGGTERGTEVLAHLAARRDLPMAANVLSVTSTDPLEVERQVAGGAVREQMRLDASPAVLTMAGHAVEASAAAAPGAAEHRPFTAGVSAADLRAQVKQVQARGGGDSSADLSAARVVVGAGRGAGSADGFSDVDALAQRLGGAVGVSRAVTSLGWRPHHEQVGQTGSRIAPDVYIACGISGAIQHWAGCSSSKTIIAINTDAEAPMMTKADYAVVGDMHEVLPALLEALG